MITIRDIRKSFDERPVLRGVNIDVRDRETLVVLGRSGGGKSVMLKMILGLVKPDSGSISVDGSDVLLMTYPRLRELRFKFGFLFQGAALFDSLNVEDNVGFLLRREGRTPPQAIARRRSDCGDEPSPPLKLSPSLIGLGAGGT